MKKVLIITLLFSFNSFAKDFTLQEIERYMSNLKNLQVSFDQIVPGQDFSKGELFVRKPGKFLWQYNMPSKAKIVSNGGLIYFIDQETGQTTQIPNNDILFTLLSKENVKLNNKNLKLKKLNQDLNTINVDLLANVENNEVPVRLMFKKLIKKQTIELRKIISKNQLDQSVVVSLYNHDISGNFSNDIFKIEVEDEQF